MKNRPGKNYMNNLGLKAIALISGFAIWLLVTNTNNPVQTVLFSNVPITIINQDSIADIGKVVEPEGSGTVTVKVTERRSVLERLARNGSDFYVEADLENINDMNSVPLTVSCSRSSITWDEMEISPGSLKVTMEDKLEQAFAISVSTSGSPANGYAVGVTEIEQGKNIFIAGPESTIKIINQVVAPVNISGTREDVSMTSVLKIIDKNGSELTENQLKMLEIKDGNGTVLADRQVQVGIRLWHVQTDIPVEVSTVGEPAYGYRVSAIETIPVTISLAGTEGALSQLEAGLQLDTPVNISGITEDMTQDVDLTETLSGIEGVKLITDADPIITVNVKVEKNGDTTVNYPVGKIQLRNRPDNRNLVFSPADKIVIRVHADDAGTVRTLNEEDISASVDLQSCRDEGAHELPVSVTLPEGYELAAPVSLVVNSTVQEQMTEEAGQ